MEGFEVRPPGGPRVSMTTDERRAQLARAAQITGIKHTTAGKTLILWMNDVAKAKEISLLTRADPADTATMAEALGEIRELREWIAHLEADPKQETEEGI